MFDLYTPARMIKQVQRIVPPATFLLDHFVQPATAGDIFGSEKVLVELRDGDRRIAPHVMDTYPNGVVSERAGQELWELEPELVSVRRTLTLADLKKKAFGEDIFPTSNEADRARMLLTRDLDELNTQILRREEAMTAGVLLTNKIEMKLYGSDMSKPKERTIEFFEGENDATVAGDTDWNKEGAKPLDDLSEAVGKLLDNGLPAEDFVGSPDVIQALLATPEIRELLDNRRFEVGQVRPEVRYPGAAWYGILNVDGTDLNLWGYRATYVDVDGTTKPYVPKGWGFVSAPKSLQMLYGAVTQIDVPGGDYVTHANARVPKVIVNEDEDQKSLTLKSRPLTIPRDVNCSISIHAIAGE